MSLIHFDKVMKGMDASQIKNHPTRLTMMDGFQCDIKISTRTPNNLDKLIYSKIAKVLTNATK